MKWIGVLLSCVCFSALGQEYVVTNKGDTLRGKLKVMSYDQIDRIQVTGLTEKTMLTARQVRLFLLDGKFYQPLQFDNSIRFMEIVKGGYLSLLQLREGSPTTTSSGRFLVKRDGDKMEVPNLTFKKNMAEFVAESPSLQKKIKEGEYGKRDLNKIIDEFNSYINNTTIIKHEEDVQNQGQLEPLEKLRKSVDALASSDTKKNSLELIDDLMTKIKSNQPIPHYLLDTLEKYLTGEESTREDLAAALKSLK